MNDKILSASQSGRSPNSLLDLRDKLIDEISKLADITPSYTDRGVANVTIGASGVGPSLISGKNRQMLDLLNVMTRLAVSKSYLIHWHQRHQQANFRLVK